MIKDDEIAFFAASRHLVPGKRDITAFLYALDIAAGLNIHPKRAYRILEKWSSRGWWDYGVSVRTGWFTDKAPLILANPEPKLKIKEGDDGTT